MQDNVVNHIALVFGVIEAERAAQIFGEVVRYVVVVTGVHVHGEGIPEVDSHTDRRIIELLIYPVCYSLHTHINSTYHTYTTPSSFSLSLLTCSRWKRNSLCTWRASCHRGGPCSADAGSACTRSWTRRTRKWGRRLVDCQPLLSHQVLSRKTFDCGRPAGND